MYKNYCLSLPYHLLEEKKDVSKTVMSLSGKIKLCLKMLNFLPGKFIISRFYCESFLE